MPRIGRRWIAVWGITLAGCINVPRPLNPLVGVWRLDLARTQYGPGADHRREETFTCTRDGDGVRCTIDSVRSNGQRLVGRFSAGYDGRAAPVSGIPDVDEVSLRRSETGAVAATFALHGRPVFAYLAERSADGRTLTMVSIDPVTRTRLHSVVVYDRVVQR